MKINIGLVGPADSVELVTEVAEEFTEQINLQPYIYNEIEEAPGIISMNGHLIDIWIFTGLLPYRLAILKHPNKKLLLIPSSGSALMKQLFQIVRDGRNPGRASIETLQKNTVIETFHELNISSHELQIFSTENYVPSAEVVSFHTSLYEQGKVEACLTYRAAVYDALQKRKIPVYRITPTRTSIRETLKLACQHGETNRFRKSQIAVIVIAIKNNTKQLANTYEAYRLNLKIQQLIVMYAEKIAGSILPSGNEKFIVFAARGAVEEQLDADPANLLNQIKLVSNSDAYCGIGYGITALGAEQNASLALQHAQQKMDSCAVVVDERGNIAAPLQNNKNLVYNYRSEDQPLIERLKKEGINVATFNRLVSLQNSLDKKSLCAADIAEWLQMTQRNANRILAELERCGLAKVIGEETPTAKGRPRKVFRVGPDGT